MPLSFDRVADYHDRTRGGSERADRLVSRLVTHLPPHGRVLDVGAGTGIVTEGFLRRRGAVCGVDLSPKMLAIAATRVPGRLARADAARLPFLDNTFAAAYAVWVFHLLDDQDAVFGEAARVPEPGGRFAVLTTSQHQRDDDSGELIGPVLRRLRPARLRRADPEKLTARAEGAGLRLEMVDWKEDDYVGWSPNEEAGNIERKSMSVLWDLGEK